MMNRQTPAGWGDITPSAAVAMDRARAMTYTGRRLALSVDQDRVAVDGPPRCPTCSDGILTIVYARRCRECTLVGL